MLECTVVKGSYFFLVGGPRLLSRMPYNQNLFKKRHVQHALEVRTNTRLFLFTRKSGIALCI